MLSYHGLAEEFSIKVKDSYSKFSNSVKKIFLVEDKKAQKSNCYFQIFKPCKNENKLKLKDTKMFTEPKLNYCAQMQLAEQYFIMFYAKGGYSNYNTYEDLFEDQLIEISDSDEEESQGYNQFEFRGPRSRKFTFQKRPSDQHKR